jgi:hypothetical protein
MAGRRRSGSRSRAAKRIRDRTHAVAAVFALLAVAAAPAAAQPAATLRADPVQGHRPVLAIGPILNEPPLHDAVRSGLPLRVHVRIELWRDGFFDSLVGQASWSSVLVHEPMGQHYIVRPRGPEDAGLRFATYAAARTAIEGEHTAELRPTRPGRYYYTATITIETLSLSDLDELERWLQGELQPAVSGERSVPSALLQGARRLLVRLLRLPARRLDVRSERFSID